MTIPPKSQQNRIFEESRRTWPGLPKAKLVSIRDGLESERRNPDADREFVDQRLRLVRSILAKK